MAIYIPRAYWDQIAPVRAQLNISRVCAEALVAEVERLKTPKAERTWNARLAAVRAAAAGISV